MREEVKTLTEFSSRVNKDFDEQFKAVFPPVEEELVHEIGLKRKEKDRYKVALEAVEEAYKAQEEKFTPEIMRICVNGTFKWPEGCENESFHTGLYFDVFPLDNGFGTDQDIVDLEQCTRLHTKLLQSLHRNFGTSFRGCVKKLRSRTIPRYKYINLLVSLISKHKQACGNVYLSFPASYAGICRSYFDKSYFDETVLVQFEDLKLPVPKEYDKLLKYMYGDDYMTPISTKPHRTVAYIIE